MYAKQAVKGFGTCHEKHSRTCSYKSFTTRGAFAFGTPPELCADIILVVSEVSFVWPSILLAVRPFQVWLYF